jgi:hypothetical protein
VPGMPGGQPFAQFPLWAPAYPPQPLRAPPPSWAAPEADLRRPGDGARRATLAGTGALTASAGLAGAASLAGSGALTAGPSRVPDCRPLRYGQSRRVRDCQVPGAASLAVPARSPRRARSRAPPPSPVPGRSPPPGGDSPRRAALRPAARSSAGGIRARRPFRHGPPPVHRGAVSGSASLRTGALTPAGGVQTPGPSPAPGSSPRRRPRPPGAASLAGAGTWPRLAAWPVRRLWPGPASAPPWPPPGPLASPARGR